jgi:hypothetical protein
LIVHADQLFLGMVLFSRIQLKYRTLVPAIYFAAIGCFDIISDAIVHKLVIGNILLNFLLFVPLVWRKYQVYIVSGIVTCLFSVYALLAIFVWFIKFLKGAHCRYPFDTFVIGPIFALLTLFMGMLLLSAGIEISRQRQLSAGKNDVVT